MARHDTTRRRAALDTNLCSYLLLSIRARCDAMRYHATLRYSIVVGIFAYRVQCSTKVEKADLYSILVSVGLDWIGLDWVGLDPIHRDCIAFYGISK
eukprot:jgi/Psemu1/264299/estExt_Genewise1Plus.C_15540010